MSEEIQPANVGRITGVFGIKGWLKIASFTEPDGNLFDYQPWLVKLGSGWSEIEVAEVRRHQGGWIVRLEGVNDRDEASLYKLKNIAVDRSKFAQLGDGEFYWHQLIGLRVLSQHRTGSAELLDFGRVEQMLETGANDVMIIRPDKNSIDDRERLVPYIPDLYVQRVDLANAQIIVNWHVDD